MKEGSRKNQSEERAKAKCRWATQHRDGHEQKPRGENQGNRMELGDGWPGRQGGGPI